MKYFRSELITCAVMAVLLASPASQVLAAFWIGQSREPATAATPAKELRYRLAGEINCKDSRGNLLLWNAFCETVKSDALVRLKILDLQIEDQEFNLSLQDPLVDPEGYKKKIWDVTKLKEQRIEISNRIQENLNALLERKRLFTNGRDDLKQAWTADYQVRIANGSAEVQESAARHGGIDLWAFSPQTVKPRTGPGNTRIVVEPPKPAFDMACAPMVASEKLAVGSELPFSVSEGLLAEVQCKVKVTKISTAKVEGQVLDKIEFKAIPGPNLTGYWLIRADRSIYRVRAALSTDTGSLGASEAPVPVVITLVASRVP